jgi:nitrite reductase (NADH) small subunit
MSNWTEICGLEDIPRLRARVVCRDAGDIAVFRTRQDEVFALRDRCPHKEGPLSQGIIHGNHVTCPLHNLVMDLTNGKAVAPDEGCTDVYPVKVEAGRVWIDFKEKEVV